MPPLIVYEGTDGVLVVYNGVTRATAGWLAGGRAFGLRVAGALLLNIGLAWAFVAAQSV